MGGYRVCAASSYLSRQTYGIKEMEKRLKILGIIDADGYELDNRVYSGGGISPCMTTGNAKKNVVRKYGNRSDGQLKGSHFRECEPGI